MTVSSINPRTKTRGNANRRKEIPNEGRKKRRAAKVSLPRLTAGWDFQCPEMDLVAEISAEQLAGAADGSSHGAEGLVGAGAQSRDCHEANHDDQGQHHGVFNGRRAVFRLEELDK